MNKNIYLDFYADMNDTDNVFDSDDDTMPLSMLKLQK